MRVGWKEFADLPRLGVTALKVKMDTGARTSALHVEDFTVAAGEVEFTLLGHRATVPAAVRTRLAGWLEVRDTGGTLCTRPVIETPIVLGTESATVRVTLADRRGMLFRMIVGRKALEALDAVVDVNAKYLLGRPRVRGRSGLDVPSERRRAYSETPSLIGGSGRPEAAHDPPNPPGPGAEPGTARPK